MSPPCRSSFWVVHRGSGGGTFQQVKSYDRSSFINARCSHWIALLRGTGENSKEQRKSSKEQGKSSKDKEKVVRSSKKE